MTRIRVVNQYELHLLSVQRDHLMEEYHRTRDRALLFKVGEVNDKINSIINEPVVRHAR